MVVFVLLLEGEGAWVCWLLASLPCLFGLYVWWCFVLFLVWGWEMRRREAQGKRDFLGWGFGCAGVGKRGRAVSEGIFDDKRINLNCTVSFQGF